MDARDAALALTTHLELVDYALPFGVGAEWRRVRERAEAVTGQARERLLSGDAAVIDLLVFDRGPVWPSLLEDDPLQPLAHWWWPSGCQALAAGADRLGRHAQKRHLRRIAHGGACQRQQPLIGLCQVCLLGCGQLAAMGFQPFARVQHQGRVPAVGVPVFNVAQIPAQGSGRFAR